MNMQAGVPMLLCPLSHKADHFGNTARVVYHGFGLKANLDRETLQSIKTKIEKLLHDPIYRTQLKTIKKQLLNSTQTAAPTYDLAK
jgi:zeaxanthin glucosyltransferase